mmetsp:Transcript_18131/g.40063  ORF Transcript_18131/g.40063 Transcript_18131/m.40063 type:complete len:358 (+) Transcript_18131:293-1366(+)
MGSPPGCGQGRVHISPHQPAGPLPCKMHPAHSLGVVVKVPGHRAQRREAPGLPNIGLQLPLRELDVPDPHSTAKSHSQLLARPRHQFFMRQVLRSHHCGFPEETLQDVPALGVLSAGPNAHLGEVGLRGVCPDEGVHVWDTCVQGCRQLDQRLPNNPTTNVLQGLRLPLRKRRLDTHLGQQDSGWRRQNHMGPLENPRGRVHFHTRGGMDHIRRRRPNVHSHIFRQPIHQRAVAPVHKSIAFTMLGVEVRVARQLTDTPRDGTHRISVVLLPLHSLQEIQHLSVLVPQFRGNSLECRRPGGALGLVGGAASCCAVTVFRHVLIEIVFEGVGGFLEQVEPSLPLPGVSGNPYHPHWWR